MDKSMQLGLLYRLVKFQLQTGSAGSKLKVVETTSPKQRARGMKSENRKPQQIAKKRATKTPTVGLEPTTIRLRA